MKPRKTFPLLEPEKRASNFPGVGVRRTMDQRTVEPPNNEVPAKRTRPSVTHLDKNQRSKE